MLLSRAAEAQRIHAGLDNVQHPSCRERVVQARSKRVLSHVFLAAFSAQDLAEYFELLISLPCDTMQAEQLACTGLLAERTRFWDHVVASRVCVAG